MYSLDFGAINLSSQWHISHLSSGNFPTIRLFQTEYHRFRALRFAHMWAAPEVSGRPLSSRIHRGVRTDVRPLDDVGSQNRFTVPQQI